MDFVILKVNGRDVSHSSHEEAVEAFLKADEPITVEVLRRAHSPTNSTQDLQVDNNSITEMPQHSSNSIAIQTDVALGVSDLGVEEYVNDEVDDRDPCINYSVIHNQDGFEEDIIIQDLDYEEVILHRNVPGEALGLTLCYETDTEDGLTDIFIDDIHTNRLAAADGRLRLGDQIIQIDGEDIKTKVQAQDIFLRNSGDITFLVARPQLDYMSQKEKGEETETACEPPALSNTTVGNRSSTESADSVLNVVKNRLNREEEHVTPQSSSCQKSEPMSLKESVYSAGSGHMTTKEELLNTSKSSTSNSSANSGSGSLFNGNSEARRFPTSKSTAVLSVTNNGGKDLGGINLDKELYYVDTKLNHIHSDCEVISAKQNPGALTAAEPIYETIPENDEVYCLPVDHVPKINPVSSTMCRDRLILKQPQKSLEGTFSSGMNRLIRSTSLNKYEKNRNIDDRVDVQRSEKIKEVEHWLKTSCNSISDKKVVAPSAKNTVTLKLAANDVNNSTLSLNPKRTAAKTVSHPHQRYMPGKMPLKGTMPRPRSLQSIAQSADTMHAKMENLQETMRIQQTVLRHGQRNSFKNGCHVSCPNPVFQAPPPPPLPPSNSKRFLHPNWEWKVKIRTDGSRYIARRPGRNRVLREREAELNEERSGLTTDDDAISELKAGRYCPKEDRRNHINQSKERRKKQLAMIADKSESLNAAETRNIGTPVNNCGTERSHFQSPTNQSNHKQEPVLLSVTSV